MANFFHINRRGKWPSWVSFTVTSLDSWVTPLKLERKLISSSGVLLPSPDAFKLIDLVLFVLKFMSWKKPPLPRVSFQVVGTIHPAPCL